MLSNELEIKYTVPEEQPEQHIDPNNKRSIKRVKVIVDQDQLEGLYAYRIPDDRKEVSSFS